MTGSHLGAALLAEYDEGILPARATADVAAHLAHCPLCTETHRQLAEVTARLASAPAVRIPEDVAARVDDALAGEQRSRSNYRDGKIAPIRPLRARLPSMLAAAAVVGAVAFAGYVVGTGSGADDAGDQATSAESDADESVDSEPESESDVAGGADAPAPLGTEPLSPQGARTALTEQIQAIVAQSRAAAAPEADRESSDGTCGATLATEVARGLIGAAPTDLGAPGAVLVVTAASTPDAAQGWVLPACDATASDALTMLTVPLE